MSTQSLPADADVVAFIDLGTNAVRLMVVRIGADHSYAVITQQREEVRLGEHEFAQGVLQPQAMERALLVCRSFAALARSYGAQQIVAVATSATREATNRLEFIHRLRHEAGLEMHVVSGREEARLIYQGLLLRVEISERTAFVIDIGGGSTEVAVGNSKRPLYLGSISTGALRLADELSAPVGGAPLPAELAAELTRRVKLKSAHTVTELRRYQIDVAYGTSGTIKNLAAASARVFHDAAPERDQPMSRTELRKILRLLRDMPVQERGQLPGIDPSRADTILAGATILESIMTDVGLKEIIALTDCGLRGGLLRDHLQRSDHHGLLRGVSVRERSVLQLGRACKFDEAHARRIRALAVGLFDSSRLAGLHDLGESERELLAYAALLHDIGSFLSYRDHHLHSAYLVRNSELLGFDQDEIAVMAAAVQFHRKALPTPRHPLLSELRRRDREAVQVLSLLLRIAEPLDRSRSACVRSAGLVSDGPTIAVLELETVADCSLELWAVERQREAIRLTLGRSLALRTRAVAGQPQTER